MNGSMSPGGGPYSYGSVLQVQHPYDSTCTVINLYQLKGIIIGGPFYCFTWSVILYSAIFSWVNFFRGFANIKFLIQFFFKNTTSTKFFTYENIALYGIHNMPISSQNVKFLLE